MRKITTYYAEGYNWPFNSEEDALKKEAELKERQKQWENNSPESKMKELLYNLEQCQCIHPQTIATCSFDCIRIKMMVKVCQAFAEKNKEYLNYY
jgi:hypothetical protein